jgi:asparagine synthase (glutamine-hydrolysing)
VDRKFNGEIYNHPALRANCSSSGTFRTHSDTECIVHAYEQWGDDSAATGACGTGMPGGGCCSAGSREKPLYYASTLAPLRLELKTLLRYPVPREVNPEALHHYLT